MKFQFLHWNTSTCPLQSEDSGAIPVPHYFMLHTMSLGWIILGKNLHKKKGSNCLYIYFLSFKELGSCRDKRHVEIWISKGCNISCFTEAAWHKKKTKNSILPRCRTAFPWAVLSAKGQIWKWKSGDWMRKKAVSHHHRMHLKSLLLMTLVRSHRG